MSWPAAATTSSAATSDAGAPRFPGTSAVTAADGCWTCRYWVIDALISAVEIRIRSDRVLVNNAVSPATSSVADEGRGLDHGDQHQSGLGLPHVRPYSNACCASARAGIISIASVIGLTGNAGQANYAATGNHRFLKSTRAGR